VFVVREITLKLKMHDLIDPIIFLVQKTSTRIYDFYKNI
jgi:hypothetical protein